MLINLQLTLSTLHNPSSFVVAVLALGGKRETQILKTQVPGVAIP